MEYAVLGGSLRNDSLNLRLLSHIVRSLEGMGHQVRAISGADLRLPLYDADLPLPAQVGTLQGLLEGVRGVVLVSPEYNASIPPHLKNAVDWLSTLDSHLLKGLPVLLAAASPGAFGGSRAVIAWRPVLANLGALVLPGAITVPLADKNLAPDGTPREARTQKEVQGSLEAFVDFTRRLS
jgi:chromate reductase